MQIHINNTAKNKFILVSKQLKKLNKLLKTLGMTFNEKSLTDFKNENIYSKCYNKQHLKNCSLR